MDAFKGVLKFVPIVGAVIFLLAAGTVFMGWLDADNEDAEAVSLWDWTEFDKVIEENSDDTPAVAYAVLAISLLGAAVAGSAFFVKNMAKMLVAGAGVIALANLILGYWYYSDQLDSLGNSDGLKMGMGLMLFIALMAIHVIASAAYFVLAEDEA